jgi:hypothetical protein
VDAEIGAEGAAPLRKNFEIAPATQWQTVWSACQQMRCESSTF